MEKNADRESPRRLVTVFSSLNLMEAEMAASLLRASGIDVFISGSHTSRTAGFWFYGVPLQLMVPAVVASRAREILRQEIKPHWTPFYVLPRLTQVYRPAPHPVKRSITPRIILLMVFLLILLHFCYTG